MFDVWLVLTALARRYVRWKAMSQSNTEFSQSNTEKKGKLWDSVIRSFLESNYEGWFDVTFSLITTLNTLRTSVIHSQSQLHCFKPTHPFALSSTLLVLHRRGFWYKPKRLWRDLNFDSSPDQHLHSNNYRWNRWLDRFYRAVIPVAGIREMNGSCLYFYQNLLQNRHNVRLWISFLQCG